MRSIVRFVAISLLAAAFGAGSAPSAAAAELHASAVQSLNGYTLAYSGSGFPPGLNVGLVLSGLSGLAPFALGGETADAGGSFHGMVTLRCSPLSGATRENGTLAAVVSGVSVAAGGVSFNCLIQH